LQEHGNGCLPLILLNGAVVGKSRYPDREELARIVGIEFDGSKVSGPVLPIVKSRCCG
jgi:hypothetical protein